MLIGHLRVSSDSERQSTAPQRDALLVVNAIVPWNTIYLDAAPARLRAEGFDVREEDVACLSPLGREHVNVLGRCAFTLPEPVARGGLRPLTRPGADARRRGRVATLTTVLRPVATHSL